MKAPRPLIVVLIAAVISVVNLSRIGRYSGEEAIGYAFGTLATALVIILLYTWWYRRRRPQTP